MPLALDAWTLFDTTAVAVIDVFGDVTLAHPPDGRWKLFLLDTTTTAPGLSRLFSPPVRPAVEGPALEEVHLLPDEVANVAWAVEQLVPHVVGRSRTPPARTAPVFATAPAGLTWSLTPPSPPGNWFPLLPVEIGRLALGVLWSDRGQHPGGQWLDELRAARRLLHQEEVPAEDAPVAIGPGHRRLAPFLDWRSKTPRRADIAPAGALRRGRLPLALPGRSEHGHAVRVAGFDEASLVSVANCQRNVPFGVTACRSRRSTMPKVRCASG